MRKNRRNVNRIAIQKMLDYCNDIESYINQVNASCETYSSNGMFRRAVDMCILQIGELTMRLTDDFKAQHSEIPWHEIKGMRNIHVHEYERIDLKYMWKTLTEDIPELKLQLEKILAAEVELNDSQI